MVKRKECKICGKKSELISSALNLCVNCIKEKPEETKPLILKTHEIIRAFYNFPSTPPKSSSGIQCDLCANECVIGVGEKSYCGLRINVNGKLVSLSNINKAVLHWYPDPHVTNCCSAWFCPAGTGTGYPKFAYTKGPELGYKNLAVFFYGCNFDCLFCQNASHKNIDFATTASLEEMSEIVKNDKKYSCICFFGGSPEPQLPFALAFSKKVIEENPDRIIRICFEWNGCGNKLLVKEAAEIAFKSGGNIKFDLKCFNENLSLALSGVSNKRAYENFELIAREFYHERKNLPVLTATTLLVPGYVDEEEVKNISEFISSLNPEIPYSLLVFHPDFMMQDLPITPKIQAVNCYKTAKKFLKNVYIGNIHLLGSLQSIEY
ncbi:MAG: radical SAM protein [Candidatus Bathyarchaeia archaeon]